MGISFNSTLRVLGQRLYLAKLVSLLLAELMVPSSRSGLEGAERLPPCELVRVRGIMSNRIEFSVGVWALDDGA
jgi:hypothetical protein